MKLEKEGLWARWHATPLYQRILGGMVLGAIVGVLFGESVATLAIPSKLVLRLLGALAPALILFALIQALLKTTFEKGTAPRLVRLLILNTLVAICIGLLVADVMQPGAWAPHENVENHEAAAGPKMLQQFLENVPQSLLGPLTDQGKVIGIIFLGVAFGLAFRRVAKRPIHTISDFVDVMLETLIVILHWIIDVVPFAVFGLVASIVGVQGFGAFHALGAFVVAVIAALILQACYYLVRIRIWSWVRPFDLLRGGRDALFMAFSTGSSTITMPVTFECLRRKVGLREKSATLGAYVGANFNNDGTALYEAMAALFIAQYLGIHLEPLEQVMVVLTSVVASVGAAGIPEAGLVTMTLVFTAVGLPVEYIALLLPVDWFLDRCRTVINVMGDMNVACLLDGKTREN
jgi:DAACS family dicarboxylate/amino acid:cation (Na+ or H+) symporter